MIPEEEFSGALRELSLIHISNGTDSAGRTDVGGLGAGGRYLKGVRIEGLNLSLIHI